MSVDQVIFKPSESDASEAMQAGKATAYLESVSIPMRVNCWPYQGEKKKKGQIQSNSHQVAYWPP